MRPYINYEYSVDGGRHLLVYQIERFRLHPRNREAPARPLGQQPVAYNFVYVQSQWPSVMRAVTDLLTALVWSNNINQVSQQGRSRREQQAAKPPTVADSLLTIASFCGVLAICGLTCGLIGDQQSYWSTRLRELFPRNLSGWKNASTGFYLAALLLPFIAIPTLVLIFAPVSAVIGVIGTALLWTAGTALSALLGFRITNELLQGSVDKALLKNHIQAQNRVDSHVQIHRMSYHRHADDWWSRFTSNGSSGGEVACLQPSVDISALVQAYVIGERSRRVRQQEAQVLDVAVPRTPPLVETNGPFGRL